MVVYNFKKIPCVPSSQDCIDVILSKTQRKTPTVVHKGYQISRIRSFYMRKIKYTQQNYHDKFTEILEGFPRLEDIHPFYADLINVLYSRDHYKLALGQLNFARQLIDNLGKEYLRLMKFGDGLYRCKELKRAALGRMCTVVKKLKSSLGYLEQVRQHLSRLPSIDPNTRTLLLTGYPNVGKSSFINKVSRANVDVQPYAFTTKSLFVGHTDYRYVRWQVIDTPGILDKPLEDRNTIEMQAITALAHLKASVLYFLDISETCGYSIKQQVSLFHSIKPLFSNKPLIVVANKIDLRKMEELDQDDADLIKTMIEGSNTTLLQMSNMTEEGVTEVKTHACDKLLEHRVERKLKGKRVNDVLNRMHVAQPVARDNKNRELSIPQSVLMKSNEMEVEGKKKTLKDVELEQGGPGVFSFDLQKHWKLKNPEWQFDIVPEIIDGKNIADFVDPDIDRKLAELEAEEDELQRQAFEAKQMESDSSDLDEDDYELAKKITNKQGTIQAENRIKNANNKPVLPRKAMRGRQFAAAEEKLGSKGLDASKMIARARSKSAKKMAAKRSRRARDGEEDEAHSRGRSHTRDVSQTGRSKTPGLRDERMVKKTVKMRKLSQREKSRDGREGESDRRFKSVKAKPKWLFSGKMSLGTRRSR